MSTDNPVLSWLLLSTVISMGLMAGVYFTFSAFVMAALGKIPAAAASQAMNSINRVIERSLFAPLFVLSVAQSVVLLVYADSFLARELIISASGLYLIGMLAVTGTQNVPMNKRLLSNDGLGYWDTYLTRWTRWNHVRSVSSGISFGLYLWALLSQSF